MVDRGTQPNIADGLVSALGGRFAETPMVVPTRGHLDSIGMMMRGDFYIGRGSRQRKLDRSKFCNNYKVAEVGRSRAIGLFRAHLRADAELQRSIWTLSGRRLVCHCQASQRCHGDVLIEEFRRAFPTAHDRNDLESKPPTAATLDFVARLREVPAEESDSSPDEGVPGRRSGYCGDGEPMSVGVGYTTREYCDGQSLASPGRWPPGARKYPTNDAWIAVTKLYQDYTAQHGTEQLLVMLARGKTKESPFDESTIRELKDSVIMELEARGFILGRVAGDRNDVPTDFRYLDLLLRAAGDPEVGMGDYSQGVRVGPGVRMPRLPALFRQKRKWRLPEQADPLDYLEQNQEEGITWRRNYASLDQWKEQAIKVLRDQASRGQVLILSENEAKKRYPNLVVASLGANRKDKPNGEISARVLFDGTHGLSVNRRTRIRDQERAPIASDLKRGLREKAQLGELTFALSADISEAHRQVPIHPVDWHFLGCQVNEGSEVFIHKVGTFGISSASYYWSRVAGSIGRLAQYLAGNRCTTWHMLVADDFMLECGGPEYRMGLIVFFVLCLTCGVPLSWGKTAGGDSLVWVGFEILLRSHSLGLSHRRAEWLKKWTEQITHAGTIHMAAFEEGLGRIMFVVGALEHERPFLGPLYRFLSLHPRDSVRQLPPYVIFMLRFISEQIQKQRHYPCATYYATDSCSPRVDAQASQDRTGIGGWFPTRGADGLVSTWDSPWFSLEVTKNDFPWVYERGDKPSLIISTLEALAILIALKLRYGQSSEKIHTKVMVVPSITDNRGNGSALNKLMSTRFPSSAILMELATYMKNRGLRTIVEWAPREFNRESDKLANGNTDGFNPQLELKVKPADLAWEVLPEALNAGREAESMHKLLKERGALPDRGKRQRRRDPQTRLRVADPW